MYLIAIGWLYVALMMAVAEATNSNGTVLGAMITFVFYGLAPVALVVYLMGSPLRRRKLKAREAAEQAEQAESSELSVTPTDAPDAGGETPGATNTDSRISANLPPVAPVRKEL